MGEISSYTGSELELFARAHHWKKYIAAQIAPHLHGRVLEVGAGLANTTPFIFQEQVTDWLCLEPDASLAARIQDKISARELPACCRLVTGSLADLPAEARFQAILYIDVLEHIADDRREMESAAQHLLEGGKLIVMSPAHQWLTSEFDVSIGHHRRYSRRSLLAIAPSSLTLVTSSYLDSAGLLASAANRLLLRQGLPTEKQIDFWDRVLVRLSLFLDRMLLHHAGKSILAVWKKKDSVAAS